MTESVLTSLVFPSLVEDLVVQPWSQHLSLSIKRDDLIHPVLSGNKARKLVPLVQSLSGQRRVHIATMGGHHSNYLHALGYLCNQMQWRFTAFIRGTQPNPLTPTLKDLVDWNAHCQFVSFEFYRKLRNEIELGVDLADQMEATWLPEGGSTEYALQGMIEATNELMVQPDVIFVPVGTGTTALGIALGLEKRGWKTKVMGIVVLKGADKIEQSLKHFCHQSNHVWPENLILEHQFCDRGFGKVTPFIERNLYDFEQAFQIELEPVYSVKMCLAVRHYAQLNLPSFGHRWLLWHTGGLQGKRATIKT